MPRDICAAVLGGQGCERRDAHTSAVLIRVEGAVDARGAAQSISSCGARRAPGERGAREERRLGAVLSEARYAPRFMRGAHRADGLRLTPLLRPQGSHPPSLPRRSALGRIPGDAGLLHFPERESLETHGGAKAAMEREVVFRSDRVSGSVRFPLEPRVWFRKLARCVAFTDGVELWRWALGLRRGVRRWERPLG